MLADLQRASDSSIAREADGVLYTHAGPEIGVASTKAFTTQLVGAATCSPSQLGAARGTLSRDADAGVHARGCCGCPRWSRTLRLDATLEAVAQKYIARARLPLPRPRHHFPIALEGALKLKEISYIHAEGYAAGEMKHGPIALIDENMPVVVLAHDGPGYEKMISQPRGGPRARTARSSPSPRGRRGDRAARRDDVISVPTSAST